MGISLAKTYGDQLRDVVDEYRHSGEPWPATSRQIAVWAYNNGEIVPQPGSVIKQIARDISDAMREEYYTDPQGRTVRVKHVARRMVNGSQQMLWDDIRTAEPEHMERSLKLRRQQIVGDCAQLKRDKDSYNDNNKFGASIQLSFNFENDIAELETLNEFPKSTPPRKPR